MADKVRTYTTSDLSRRSGDIITAAIKSPVILTQRKKPRLVLLSVEEFDALRQKADPRRVGRTAEMPADLADEFAAAIDAHHDDAGR